MDFLEQDGIAVKTFEEACAIVKILINNGNAVMITTEEELFIVNWVWCDSGFANRNDVIFTNRAGWEVDNDYETYPQNAENCGAN